MTGVNGAWSIDSVQVNAELVKNNDGFERLVVGQDQICIEPAGIHFSVSQSTTRSAILESRSQVFFAEYVKRGNELMLELTRPKFDEKVRLNASMS